PLPIFLAVAPPELAPAIRPVPEPPAQRLRWRQVRQPQGAAEVVLPGPTRPDTVHQAQAPPPVYHVAQVVDAPELDARLRHSPLLIQQMQVTDRITHSLTLRRREQADTRSPRQPSRITRSSSRLGRS